MNKITWDMFVMCKKLDHILDVLRIIDMDNTFFCNNTPPRKTIEKLRRFKNGV